ncbi:MULTISPECIES: ABC transporter ATP-binding protein [Pantoea]|jgi:peptide/nickel transport system ATP-binding protein|uniref:Oligopeptide/dipeptide ABC transporter ATP-binding protein n=3 Tax=Pantoea TaxID=53335 RepID=A0AAU7TW83_9GAMM|nr:MULTISPECIES: oligopeptide/dipeptide ABC transporter ATP-binding protein [Pantoea]MBD9645820.1 ATP-binding cassette domain-containing protein [Pantoea sp. PNT02]MBY4840543.1 ATP-binding cassette domain-containing protein [Pantoea sp. DY-5]MBY4953970.1 ATP-binding cassette domain-containing protein [Pantoea sp. DY-17]MDR6352311.1 peptide/nickel transport system ATP-binding protein [Pantoea sp. SORGH_AS_0659]PLR20789.1 oligopeptide ABC transporter ATP-binding protein [Pantoea endophytica]
MKPILECRDLSKTFSTGNRLFSRNRGVTAVDRVALQVMPGETLAIVGESGSGKSTLGRLLLRLLAASAGDVFYQGESITDASGARLNQLRRELQIIFQDPFASLNPRMTVQQIVGEPLWLHEKMSRDQRHARVAELLRTVGLPAAWAERYPHEFSGGQRQRIGIARALASQPKLLLGDEPVSALDVSVQAQVVNLLESLKQQFGLTMVIVAHGLAVIRHMSDRVAVMYLGQIVELASVDEIFDAPLHPYTQALIASAPQMQPGVSRTIPMLQGDLPNPADPPSGCRFHTRCPYATAECRQFEPINQVLSGGRQIACHRWQEINRDRSVITLAPPSAAFLRRRALFEQAVNQQA